MTINTIDFSTWFSVGCYGGLASCMLSIAANVLYTTLRHRGTNRQLAAVILICVLSALLLLPAIIWFNLRFSIRQGHISPTESEIVLTYVAFCGWLLPLGATITYCLFTRPRDQANATHIPGPAQRNQQGVKQQPSAQSAHSIPPRYQPGVPIPFVYGEDTPWGWLEYRNGSFQGQRLALKRTIITIGRDETNEIWLDDDMASRHHAELAWHDGAVYLTDCDSLNGVQLNGQRIQQSVPIASHDLLEIGSHHFSFILEEEPRKHQDDSDDPLIHHKWRSALDSLTSGSDILPATRPLNDRSESNGTLSPDVDKQKQGNNDSKQTEKVDQAALVLPASQGGALIVRSGGKEGQCFRLSRAVVTVGRGIESDVIINDSSISRRHVQFLRRADGDYVQDLGSRNGTRVNEEPLTSLRLLEPGDKVLIGNICLEYTSVQSLQTTPLMMDITPPPKVTGPISGVGLAPLRLPSRQKE